MWFEIATALLVATSCVNAQLRQDEVAQFTLAGGCTNLEGKIGAKLDVSLSNGVLKIDANHVPNHEWQIVNPNSPNFIPSNYTFTAPTPLPEGQELCTNLGPVGIAKNGVFIFDPTAGTGENAKTAEIMDLNHGHTTPFGSYHYHYLPDNKVVWDASDPRSQFIGVAFDGYPIYSNGTGIDLTKLDKCRGMEINGRYTYIATPTRYPYFIGCFHGKPQVERAVGCSICANMTSGQACTCSFGIKTETEKRRLLDMIREISINRKRQYGRPTFTITSNETFCGGREADSDGPSFGPPPGMGGPGRGPPPGMGGPGRGPRPGNGPPPGMGGPGGGPGGPRQSLCAQLQEEEEQQQPQTPGGQGGITGSEGNPNGQDGMAGSGGNTNGQGGMTGFGGNTNGQGGMTGFGNGGLLGQTGPFGIPPWLLYLMYLEWRNQRLSQFNGGYYGGNYGNNNGRGSGSSYKRSKIEQLDQSDQREMNEFIDYVRNTYGYGQNTDNIHESKSLSSSRSNNRKSDSNKGSLQGVSNQQRSLHNNQQKAQEDDPVDDLLELLRKALRD